MSFINSYNLFADSLVNTFAMITGVYGFYRFLKKS